MMFLLKKYRVILAVVLVVLIALGIFFIWSKYDSKVDFGPLTNLADSKTKYTFKFENFSVIFNYPKDWQISTSSSGRVSDKQDQLLIEVSQTEKLNLQFWTESAWQEQLKSFQVESESQSEINGRLSQLYHLADTNGQRLVAYVLALPKYNLVVSANLENLVNLENLKQSIILELSTPGNEPAAAPIFTKPSEVVTKIFFPSRSKDGCQADGYLTVKLKDIDSSLDLIPKVIKIILQQNGDELQQFGLNNFVDRSIKLTSFGYDNNQAVVNFDRAAIQNLTECQLRGFVSQVSQSLFELNKTTDLKIKSVKFEVDGTIYKIIP